MKKFFELCGLNFVSQIEMNWRFYVAIPVLLLMAVFNIVVVVIHLPFRKKLWQSFTGHCWACASALAISKLTGRNPRHLYRVFKKYFNASGGNSYSLFEWFRGKNILWINLGDMEHSPQQLPESEIIHELKDIKRTSFECWHTSQRETPYSKEEYIELTRGKVGMLNLPQHLVYVVDITPEYLLVSDSAFPFPVYTKVKWEIGFENEEDVRGWNKPLWGIKIKGKLVSLEWLWLERD